MKKYLLASLLLISFAKISSAQEHTLKTSVYFKPGKYFLQKDEMRKLDSFTSLLRIQDIASIEIIGNTDSDADSIYNISLSRKRSDCVKNYLEEKQIDPGKIQTEYLGENRPIASNREAKGKQKNRRVDIIVNYVVEVKVSETIPVPKQEDPCKRDTLVYLPQGTSYTISICDYEKYKDCIKITEFVDTEALLNSDLSTEASDGDQLITGGMFSIQLCDSIPLLRPIVMRLAIPNRGMPLYDGCGEPVDFEKMKLWTIDKNGRWSNPKDISLEDKPDSLYYKFNISQSTTVNLDYKFPPGQEQKVKTRIVSRGSVRFVKIVLLSSGPTSIYRQNLHGKKKQSTFNLRLCPRGGCKCIMVKAIGVDAKGDTFITKKCLNDFDKKVMFGKCKVKRGKKIFALGFVPAWPKGIYRKYMVRKKDWTPLKKQPGS